jgi:CBS domain-containing protein
MTTSEPITSIMTADPSAIERSEPISEAYKLLARAPFHHLVVTDDDAPVGILSTTDILRLVYDIDGVGEQELRTFIDHQFSIDDAMSVDLKTLQTDATVRDAAALLSDGSFHSVVVLDIDGTLAGIVTTTDLARYVRDL